MIVKLHKEPDKMVSMLKEKKANAHLKPGQNGTKRLVEKYGDALVNVRTMSDVCPEG